MNKMKIFIPGLLLLGAVAVIGSLGCNEGPVNPPATDTYTIQGALVLDEGRSMATAAATIGRDSSPLQTADLTVGDAVLTFGDITFPIDSVYSYRADSLTDFPAGSHDLVLVDSSLLVDSLLVTAPDTFSMTIALPANRIILGTGNATLDWTGAAGTETYVLATVKADQTYSGLGYSTYSLTGTGGTIPGDAFLIPGTPNPDTGLYNCYVYAVWGSPDSALCNPFLPVPLPAQQSDNIGEPDLTGHFGAIMVSLADTVRVVVQVSR